MSSTNPNFVIIGAMKSGSTSLSRLLESCPEIFFTEYKEPGFFSRDERYQAGVESYLKMYESAAPDQLTAEASTCYSRKTEFPLAAERLFSHNPDCKLVYLMRDPVKRTYSDYAHRMAERVAKDSPLPTMSYSDALQELPEILAASNYYEQIKHYLNYFSPNQLHLIFFEDLIENTFEEISKLYDFLGIASPPKNLAFDQHNASGTKFANRSSKKIVRSIGRSVPGPIKNILPQEAKDAMGRRIRNFLTWSLMTESRKKVKKQIDPPSDELHQLVYEMLLPSILDLEKLTGKDLSLWKSKYRDR